MEIERISPDQLKSLMRDEKLVIIDVRNPQAWAESESKIAGARRLTLSELETGYQQLAKDKTLVFYCT